MAHPCTEIGLTFRNKSPGEFELENVGKTERRRRFCEQLRERRGSGGLSEIQVAPATPFHCVATGVSTAEAAGHVEEAFAQFPLDGTARNSGKGHRLDSTTGWVDGRQGVACRKHYPQHSLSPCSTPMD